MGSRIMDPFSLASPFLNDPFFAGMYQQLERIATDVTETPEGYKVEAEVPGFSKDQISIKAEGSTLYISGSIKEPAEGKEVKEEGSSLVSSERVKEAFERIVRLPDKIDAENVKAHLNHGVLSIQVPKAEGSDAIPIKIE
jgi:HSP20 family protein